MFDANEQRRKDMLAIDAMLAKTKDGDRVSWLEFQKGTGIKMDLSGKALVRAVLKKQGRYYVTMPGFGLELSSAENVIDVMRPRFVRLRHAAGYVIKAADGLMARHGKELSSANKARLLEAQGHTATLELVRKLKA